MAPKFTNFKILIIFLLCSWVSFSLFNAKEVTQAELVVEPGFRIEEVTDNLIEAKAFAIFDTKTGQVLTEKNIDVTLPIASVTKLFTATALFEKQVLEQKGIVTYSDLLAEGRSGSLEVGQIFSFRDMLFPLLLESSNDAAAFYERETEGRVINWMNELSDSLELSETSFGDASGLSDRNISNVVDLISFTKYLETKMPYILDVTRLRQYVGPYAGHVNNSPVLDSSYLGGKHGYTEAAERTILVIFNESFNAEQRSIGYIVLGSQDLRSDIDILRAYVRDSVVYK